MDQQPSITIPDILDAKSTWNLHQLLLQILENNQATLIIGGSVVVSANETVDGNLNVKGNIESNGTAGVSGSVTLAKLTTMGTNGSLTFTKGLITSYSSPT